ncbi:MAG TPA: ATP-binding cassette domain-containing protein [Rhabdaerophilum sp.]|nr:ATP-binding cassette domain-containing protein [Rhabdaerophilum sp.]
MESYRLDGRIARRFLRFSGGFWRGESARSAWLLTLGLALFLVLSTSVTLGLNRWQKWFFDALERKDVEAAGWSVLVFVAIIAAMAAIGVGIVLTREFLQVRWRAWLVERLVVLWTGRNRFYHLGANHTQLDNPEYRISDDTRWATEPMVDLVIGLFSAVIGAAAFVTILWTVGGSYRVTFAGTPVVIPAYMVLLALVYGAFASGLILWIGRMLVSAVARKNAAEGEFRFAMMRVRENAESVALAGGAASEERALKSLYGIVAERWFDIVRQHGRITWVTNASGPMIPIVPLLFAAPKYFAGELTLGEVVQLGGAFVQVQLAISWIVDNYSRLSEWFASARRVLDIVEACDGLDLSLGNPAGETIAVERSEGPDLRLEGLFVTGEDGRSIVAATGVILRPGEHVHIHGGTGAGKTSLVRVLAGLRSAGRGRIVVPDHARLMVLPQKPYLPTGTLRNALLYPLEAPDMPEGPLVEALSEVGLAHLAPRLDNVERWDQVLGAGERQRLCLGRVFLHRPDIIVLDDALSALSEEAQIEMEARIMIRFREAILISLSQRVMTARAGIVRFEIDQQGGASRLRPLEQVMA